MNVLNSPGNSIVTRLLQKNGYTVSDVVRLQGSTLNTMNSKLKCHGMFRVMDIVFIAGLCNIKPEVLFYIIAKEQRNYGKIKHSKEKMTWYIDNIVQKEGEEITKQYTSK